MRGMGEWGVLALVFFFHFELFSSFFTYSLLLYSFSFVVPSGIGGICRDSILPERFSQSFFCS